MPYLGQNIHPKEYVTCSNEAHCCIMVLTVVALAVGRLSGRRTGAVWYAAEGGDMAAGPVILDFNLGGEPPSLDPSLGTDTTSIDVINEMFLGLTELDPDTQEAMPALATSWEHQR